FRAFLHDFRRVEPVPTVERGLGDTDEQRCACRPAGMSPNLPARTVLAVVAIIWVDRDSQRSSQSAVEIGEQTHPAAGALRRAGTTHGVDQRGPTLVVKQAKGKHFTQSPLARRWVSTGGDVEKFDQFVDRRGEYAMRVKHTPPAQLALGQHL